MDRNIIGPKDVPQEQWICRCGLPMSRNPHPDAGDPTTAGLDVGATWVCIPCTVQTRHAWSERAQRAETRAHDAEIVLGGLVDWMQAWFSDPPSYWPSPRPGDIMVLREARALLERLERQ